MNHATAAAFGCFIGNSLAYARTELRSELCLCHVDVQGNQSVE